MKIYIAAVIILFFINAYSFAQAPAATSAPRLTVAEYVDRIEERSFRGCSSSSVLEGTGNPGRSAARRASPAPRRTGTQR